MADSLVLQQFRKLQQQFDKNSQQTQTSGTNPLVKPFGVELLDNLYQENARKAKSAGSTDPLGDAYRTVTNFRNTVRTSNALGAKDPLGTALNRMNEEMTLNAYRYSTQGITDYAGLKGLYDRHGFQTKKDLEAANRQRALDKALEGYAAPLDEEAEFWQNLVTHTQTAMTKGIQALPENIQDRYLDFSGTDEWLDITGGAYRWEDLTPEQLKGITAYGESMLGGTAADRQKRMEEDALAKWHEANPIMKWASENPGEISNYLDFYTNFDQHLATVKAQGYEALPENIQGAYLDYANDYGIEESIPNYAADMAAKYQAAGEIYQPYAPNAYQQYLDQQMRRTPEGAQEWLDEAMGTEDEQAAKDNLYFVENREKYNAYGTDGTFDPSITDKMYLYINDAEGARDAADSFFMQADGVSTNPFYALRQMEPYEVGRYNKIAKEAGVDAANAYINDYLMYDLDARANKEYAEDIYANAQKNGWAAAGASALSVLTSQMRNAGYLDVLWQNLFGGDKPVNTERSAWFGLYTDSTRKGVMDSVDWNIKIGDRDWDAFDFIYGAGMSTADSLVSSSFGPSGALILGSNAAESTMREALDNGANNGQALTMGFWAGAFESIFEGISISKFLKTAKGQDLKGVKAILKELGIQGLTNASEEFNTSVANMLLEMAVMGEKGQYAQKYEYYRSMGLTEGEANAKVAQDMAWQLGQDTLAGLVQGGGMSTVAIASNAANTNRSTKAAGTGVISMGGQKNLKEIAISFDEGSNARKMAQEYNPETATPKQTGRLLREVIKELPSSLRTTVTENFAQHMRESLQEKGESGNVAEVARGITKAVAGEQLTEQEFQAVAASEYGLDVIHELAGVTEAKQKPLELPKQKLPAELKGDTETEIDTEAEPEAPVGTDQGLQIDADGGVTMINAEGKRVAVEDAGLKTDETIVIQETAQLGDAGSAAAVEAWNAEPKEQGTTRADARAFAGGFTRAVQAAMNGETEEAVLASPHVQGLSESARKAAWKAGEAARAEAQAKQAKANADRAKADGFRTTREAGEEAGVSYAQVTRKISGLAKKELQAIDYFTKELGLRVHVFDSLNGGKANGKLTKGSNVISLALDAEGGLLTRTVSHELYHFVEAWNEDAAGKIQDFVVKTLQGKEGYDLQAEIQAKIEQYDRNGVKLTPQEATREIVADSVLDIIGTEENMRKLLQQDKTLTAKVSEVLKRIMEKMREMMQKLGWQSAEVEALQHDLDYIENIRAMMDEALKTASQNYANAQYKASELAQQDSAVQEYITDMKKSTSQEDAQAALNGMVSDMFMRAEKGWLAEHPEADLDESLQKFADALKSYKRGEMALENALKRAGFHAQPREMNTALSYAGTQLLQAEARGQGSDVQYQIKQYTKNGRTYSYVKADRQVIHGDDPKAWATQITNYINDEIRHGKDVTVYTENGVPLTITKDTAGKAAFWNWDKGGNPVSKDEYALKLRIEAHIDEAAQVSIGKGPKAIDTKTHSFAREGWNYRKAYFEDFDGKYYAFQISVGKDRKVNTIYNVNEIKEEAGLPNTLKGARPQNATVGAEASFGGIVAENPESVKQKNQAEKILNQNGIELLNDDTATAQHSFKTYTKNERAKMLDALVMAGFERESAEKWLKDLDSVSAKIGADRERLDFEAADNHTMLKKNSEYRYTVDASTLCKKRLLYQGTFNAIQHALPNRMISSDELLELLTMMRDMGYETPCGICYVESMRRHLGRYAQRWLDDYKGSYIPSLDEVTTSDGLEKLRHDHPQTYDDFTKAMKKLGTANPKLVQLRTEYKGEIRTRSQRVIDYLNKHGGMRVQSYSDFEIYNALDMMQVFVDMAARGLKSQAYTKVPEYARIFGKTGQKINLSLIAEGSGLDANGNLIFSSTEGMDFETALEIRKNNSANVGTIIVGTSKEHILKCMADDRIDFIIPFHRSGWGQHEMEMMGIGMYEDFTKWQNEKHLVNGRNVRKNYDPSEYWDFSKTGKENAEAYLKKCAAEGRIPKFSNFLVNNGDGSYSLQPDGSTDGYWKTLIDFKMYDNSGKGSPQEAVKPNFNMREVNRILKEATGTASQLPVAQDVVDRFVQKLENDTQFSLKKTDIAKSVEEDAALFAQVKSDSDIADAVALVRRLYYTMRRGDSYTQEGANIPPQEDGAWENRLDKVMNQLLSETGSKYSKIKLKRKLKDLYTAMDTNGADTGEMMVYAREIAMALLEEAPGVVNEMDEGTKEILQVLKTSPFYLTDDMKSEIRGTQGSVRDYMRKNFGRMKIRAKAGAMSSLADVWAETLNPLRPDVFTLDATEADMPIILDAWLETANEKTYSSYFEGNLDQYATDMALSIILEYYDLPGMAHQSQRLRDELQEKQQEIRTNYKQKYEQRMKASRERKEATEDRQKMRKKIIKMVRSMNSRLLTNSDTKHIPQELKGAVSAMIRPFLDETGVFSKAELNQLRQQYSLLAEGGKNQDIEAAYAYDPDIQDKIDQAIQTMAGRRLSQLTLEELTDLRDIVGNLNKIIFERNEIQVKGRKESLQKLGTQALTEQKKKKTLGAKQEIVMNTLYNNTTPIYFFKRLGGIFVDLWDEVRSGQTRYILNVKKAKEFITEQIKKYNVNQWYHQKQTLKFTTEEGDDIELTKGQAMYLYATWKRELTNKLQDAAHLRIGGFVYAKTKANGKLTVDIHHPHALEQADMNKIMGYLGQQGVDFVDETVRFLSEDMAALGNETSMERYGYEKFGESYYFPYKVDDNYTETNLPKKQGETPSSLFAWGASKKTVSKANKPVVLGDFMETWANHVNEMCVYNGFAAAVDNLNRVYNFVTPGKVEKDADGNIISRQKKESLQAEIARAHGSGAADYLADITRAIAGGQIGRSDDLGIPKKLLSKFRKNNVVMSASVAIQQPSAIVRAMAHINPKYFVGASQGFRKSYSELMQYSGTANVKAMGKFDVGQGQSAKQWILDDLNSESKLKDAAGKADNIMGKAPEYMDQRTWASLWNAVKREQQARNPMMDPHSEAFLQQCGKRFDEVVDLTQVYDSVLSRSKIMRSDSFYKQMVTSFMAEPTLAMNMLQDAILNFKEDKNVKNHVTVKRAVAIYATSVFYNALLQSLVTAARDEDEEKTYLERYLAEFTENFLDGFNPIGSIPFAQDVLSLFGGYDVERADMALISDLADAWEIFWNEEKTLKEKMKAVGESVAALFGVPAKNIDRELIAIGNLYRDFTEKFWKTSMVDVKYSILEALPFTDLDSKRTAPYYERMLTALKDGDMEEYEELKSYVTGTMGKDEKTVQTGVQYALRDAMLDGKFTSEEAQKYLQKHWGLDKDDAYFKVDEWLETAEHKGDEEFNYSRYGDVYEAVKAGQSITEASKELLDNGYTMKDIKGAVQSQIGRWYKDGEMSRSEAEKLLDKYTDKDDDDIFWLMDEWDYAKKNGTSEGYSKYNEVYAAVKAGKSITEASKKLIAHGYDEKDIKSKVQSEIGNWYKDGEMSKSETEKLLRKYTDKDANGIYWQMRRWTYAKEHGTDEGYTAYNDFYKAVETGVNLRSAINEFLNHGYDKGDLISQVTSHYKDEYVKLYRTNKTAAQNLRIRLRTAYENLGYTTAKALKKIDAWPNEK